MSHLIKETESLDSGTKRNENYIYEERLTEKERDILDRNKAETSDKKNRTATIAIGIVSVILFFAPISSGISIFDFKLTNAYNIIDVFRIIFGGTQATEGIPSYLMTPLVLAALMLVFGFISIIAIVVFTILKKHVSLRRRLAVAAMIVIVFGGFIFNSSLTKIAETGNNFYNKTQIYRLVIKNKAGSVNSWGNKIDKMLEEAEVALAGFDDYEGTVERLQEISAESASVDYTASDVTKKRYNEKIFNELKALFPDEIEEQLFEEYFKGLTNSVSAINSTFGIGFLINILLMVALCGTNYAERKDGYKSNGVFSYHMYFGVTAIPVIGSLLVPVVTITGDAANQFGMNGVSIWSILFNVGKILNMQTLQSELGITGSVVPDSGLILLGIALFILAILTAGVYLYFTAKQKLRVIRRFIIIAATILYSIAIIIGNSQLKNSGISINALVLVFEGIMITASVIPFTMHSDRERYKVFSIVNVMIFVACTAFIMVPMWKVLVDSFDAMAGYGMKFWPEQFTLLGYKQIITNPSIYKPFLVSVVTTVIGTALGLLLSTLGAYVLVQFEMPGRNFLANMLLFTLIFQGGMVPTYLVMCQLGIINTIWAVILPLSINVYNLVLMRNFFEGIPKSLLEAAEIDGCSPIGIFFRIVLPLSKAALASIGLMFAVTFWNDYTNFKLYIVNNNLHNFQMKLRAMIFSSDLPNMGTISENTLQNAAIIVAIIPFMILYPICQKYFVTGVNIGAVKE